MAFSGPKHRLWPRSTRLVTACTAGLAALAGLVIAACAEETTVVEGQFGRAIPLVSGDGATIPRLLLRRDGCPGDAGGCPSICNDLPERCPEDACIPVIIDSAAPATALASAPGEPPQAERGCLEVRSGANTLRSEPSTEDLAAAVARFRFRELPLARIPGDASLWSWRIGDERQAHQVAGILGGNLLRQLAVRFTNRRDEPATITFYREFPGSEAVLADQGRAFINLQFPGDLLGKEITDFCAIGDEECDFLGLRFDQDRIRSLIQPTQMVVDACLAPAPSALIAEGSQRCRVAANADGSGSYTAPTGRQAQPLCRATPLDLSAAELARGGHAASLVIATAIPGMVLFEDSARRFFGDLDALPRCPAEDDLGSFGRDSQTCLEGQSAILYFPGWPSAGDESAPLRRLRVRSLGLVPGLDETSGIAPCQRLERRIAGLAAQCEGVTRESFPYPASDSICADAASTAAVLLGEVEIRNSDRGPDPSRWIAATIIPADHPMAMEIRRDVAPEALQPDGLLGTALLRERDTILDYPNEPPGLRIACTEPGRGTCLAMPACARRGEDFAASCCYGLPEEIVIELVANQGLFDCCGALAEGVRRELNCTARAEGREEPCPEVPCT